MFPARAGMSREVVVAPSVMDDVPRASGDEPRVELGTTAQTKCSPRERG